MTEPSAPVLLSKRAQKRIAKQQLHQATKSEWRKKKREAKKLKKLTSISSSCSKASIISHPPPIIREQLSKRNHILIDASFNDLMTQRELVSLAAQITRCYSANRRVMQPVNLTVSSFGGTLREKFLVHHPAFEKFDISFQEQDYLHLGGKIEDLVYLTADCDEMIQELDPEKTYIIGGIVDRNRHKNITACKAKAQGIACARLPIGEFMRMSSSQVLTCNHVFEILLHHCNGKSWKEAFETVIPPRKVMIGEKENDEHSLEQE